MIEIYARAHSGVCVWHFTVGKQLGVICGTRITLHKSALFQPKQFSACGWVSPIHKHAQIHRYYIEFNGHFGIWTPDQKSAREQQRFGTTALNQCGLAYD